LYIEMDRAIGMDITVYHGKFRQPLNFNNRDYSKARISYSILGEEPNGLRIDNIDRFENYLEISFSTCDPDIIKKIKGHEAVSCSVGGI